MLLFLMVNALMFSAWWLLLSGRAGQVDGSPSAGEAVVYAGLLGAAQIVLTEIVLGAFMVLHKPLLVGLNLVIAAVVLGVWLRIRRRGVPRAVAPWREVFAADNVALLVLLVFVSTWMVVAAWLLPPRGIDDVYHLPPLYQYVRQGGISLLPLELRDQFALPFNGEFLFLWPLVFFHGDTWIDLVQYVVALYGAAVLYALGRAFQLARRESLFIALLLPFTPVVLGQSGSNYVDLIAAVTQLVLIYAAVRFWQTGRYVHLVLAGVATGFGLGVKLTVLITVVAVQPLIFLRLFRGRAWWSLIRAYGGYAAVAIPFCLYWPWRNFRATGNFLYPFDLGVAGLRRSADSNLVAQLGQRPGPKAISDFLREPGALVDYLFADPGLGSFHGGFGLVFWGLAVPALVFCGFRAVQSARRGDWLPLLFWAYVPVAFLIYFFQVKSARLIYNQRYILAVVPLGLLALGLALDWLRSRDRVAARWVRGVAVAASCGAVVQLAAYDWPGFRISAAVADRLRGEHTSEYRYLRQAPWGLTALSTAWDPLDFLTRQGPGWTVFIATDWSVFWTSPTFGSRLQNRVWNFESMPPPKPDAVIYYRREGRALFYIDAVITPEAVAASGDYGLVTVAPGTEFWVLNELLGDPATRARLMEFYRRRFAPEIRELRPLLAALPADAPVITSHPLGHALRYLSLEGALAAPVQLVPGGTELASARKLGDQDVVSVGLPLPGFDARPAASLPYAGATTTFYINRRPAL